MIEEKPPLFKTWKQVYVFVLLFQAVLVALFTIFTKIYA